MVQAAVDHCVGAKSAPSARRARRTAVRHESLANGDDFVVGLLVPINGSAGI